jgi:hypothetical protein
VGSAKWLVVSNSVVVPAGIAGIQIEWRPLPLTQDFSVRPELVDTCPEPVEWG